MTWGAPSLPSGRDDFRARQLPDVHPVDDLSRFVMDRIRWEEAGPKNEVPQAYGEPAGPMAHRYAAGVRADMATFRRIVAQYVEAVDPNDSPEVVATIEQAVKAIAMRFADHPDFREEWRI